MSGAKELIQKPDEFVNETFERILNYGFEDQNVILVSLHDKLLQYRHAEVEDRGKHLEKAKEIVQSTPFGH